MADIGMGVGDIGIGGTVGQSDARGGAEQKTQKRTLPQRKSPLKDGTTTTAKESKPKEPKKPAPDDRKPSPKLTKKLRRGRRAQILAGVTKEDIENVLLGGRPTKSA